jgi:hypothetical protein
MTFGHCPLTFSPDPLQQIVAVPVQIDAAITFGKPVELPIKNVAQGLPLPRSYDITPEGKNS